MTLTIRILIADDHPMLRKGICALIDSEADMQVIGEAQDGEEAVLKARELDPDVILMDLVMPNLDGIQAIQKIRKENTRVRILVLTSFAEDDKVVQAIKAGALGYLLKVSSSQEVIQAIRSVSHGEPFLYPTIANKLVHGLNQPNEPSLEQILTEREIDVLKLIAKGYANQDIAESLHLSERTVRVYVTNILGKLHLSNRTQAAVYAIQQGLD